MTSIAHRIIGRLLKSQRSCAGNALSDQADALQLEERVLFSAAPVAELVMLDPALSDATSADSAFDSRSFDSTADSSATTDQQTRRELVFVDTSAENYQLLVDDLSNNADADRELKVVLLDADRDGIEQISEVMAGYKQLDAVHIVSHGDDGVVKLGNTFLRADNLDAYAAEINGWSDSLSGDADLLFYGCDLAANEDGRTLVEAISQLTGADVAASINDTGHSQYGADWELEYIAGNIETSVAFSDQLQQDWDAVMALFTVTSANDTGPNSLRQAITNANTNPGPDTIDFAISGAGPHTISPSSPLPTITETVNIDGFTEPGSSANTASIGNNAVYMVTLDGTAAGGDGLTFGAGSDGSTLQGLVFANFSGNGIVLQDTSNVTVAGNFIGVDRAGTADVGAGGNGILIIDADTNTVGGMTPADRNLISGNGGEGIQITGSLSTNNLVQGNYIGTNRAGTASLFNDMNGILITGGATGNIIGGTESGAGNLISGNGQDGIQINGNSTDYNKVWGNLIGTDASGTSPLANGLAGVNNKGGASYTEIGGLADGAGNTIAYNTQQGVTLGGGQYISIQGNRVFDNLGSPQIRNEGGVNFDQASPNLLSAVVSAGQVSIYGDITGEPAGTYTVDFFASSGADEAESYLGSKTVLVSGATPFAATFDLAGAPGYEITAILTDPEGNSSELSSTITALEPVAHYRFDEGRGTVAIDSSGRGNNGTLDNEITVDAAYTPGTVYTGLDFAGTDEYVSVADPADGSLDAAGDLTLSLWFRTTQDPSGAETPMLVYKTAGATGYEMLLWDNAGSDELKFKISDGVSTDEVNTGVAVNDGAWHHVVVTKSATELKLYLDGVNVDTQAVTVSPVNNAAPLQFGNGSGDLVNFDYEGDLDEISIYNTALADNDVANLFAAPAAATTPGVVSSLLMTIENDENAPTGLPGFTAAENITGGEVIEFGDPNLTLGATTDGTFARFEDLDLLAVDGNVRIDAVHYVGTELTVGSANAVTLKVGDLLLSTNEDEAFTNFDASTFSVKKDDVFVYRPSEGKFIFLLEGNGNNGTPIQKGVRGISLVEQDTTVGFGSGATTLRKGSFLLTMDGGGSYDRDIWYFNPTDVGRNTTSGTNTVLIDGSMIGIDDWLSGVDLVERDVTIGGETLLSGQILATMDNDDSGTGVVADRHDIFKLYVTSTGATTTAANSYMFMDGSEVGLDAGNEDNWGLSLLASTPGNTAPNATPNSNTIVEDTVAPVSGNVITDDDGFGPDTDAELDPLTVIDIDGEADPANDVTGSYGTLDWSANGDYSYTLDNTNLAVQALNVGDSLTDTFTYTIDDGQGNIAVATLTVTIDGVNDDPVLVRNSTMSVENAGTAPLSQFLLEVRDVDNLPVDLTYTIGGLTNGHVAFTSDLATPISVFTQDDIDAGLVAYVHDGSATTTDSFTFTVTDTDGGSYGPDTFDIAVQSAIVAQPDSATTDEANAISVSPALGMLANDTNIDLDYTPSVSLNYDAQEDTTTTNDLWEDATGAAGFDWDFSGANVTHTNTPTNPPPGIESAYVFDGSGGGINDALQNLSGDPSNNDATFEFWINPSSTPGSEVIFETGTSGGGTSFTLNGTTLEFNVDDPDGDSARLTADLSSEIAADEYIHIVGVINIVGGADANVSLYVNGVLVDTDFGNQDLNDWDHEAQAGLGQVHGLINSPNTDPFVGEIAAFRFYENDLTPAQIQQNYDAVVTPLWVTSIDTTGTLGLVAFNSDGSYDYDPNGQFESLAAGETTTDTFTYTVTDGTNTATASVTITINGLNDNPSASDDSNTTDEDSPLVVGPSGVLANDTDTDTSDTKTVIEVNGSPASVGTQITLTTSALLTLNSNGSYNYDPNGAFEWLAVGESTTDSFTYKVSDGKGGTDTATVTITITGTNDGPTAVDDSGAGFATSEDVSFTTGNVLANDTDSDATDALSVSSIDVTGTLGTVIDNGDGTFDYNPDGQFASLAVGATATDTFSYTVNDGNGGTAMADVTITINGTGVITGTIYEDVDGDGAVSDDNVTISGATVHLYADDGTVAGEIDAADSLLNTTVTDASGDYSFAGLDDNSTYWVVVDSRTITPSAGFNGGLGLSDTWAEQTYGAADSVAFDGSYSYSSSAGVFYGGMQSEVADDASALVSAEHVTRVMISGADATNVDSGFSFNVITRTGDGDVDAAATGRTLQGSLRQFIGNSNAISGVNTSQFAIPTTDSNHDAVTGAFRIQPLWELPTITDAVVIDGYTQAGASPNSSAIGNNATLLIEVNGFLAPAGTNGLVIDSGDSTVRGLVINNFNTGFGGSGIVIQNGGNNVIEGNFIGTDVTGLLEIDNDINGVRIVDSANNLIGGLTPSARNLISGHDYSGVAIIGAGSFNNQVQGNYIGTDLSGTFAIGNLNGVWIASGAHDNLIGGTAAGAGNVISGNNDDGVEIEGSTTTRNFIQGNFIGTNPIGTFAVANVSDGVLIEDAPDNTIGGTTANARNIISGNVDEGIHIAGSNATLNKIQGNYIGTTSDGAAALTNYGDGIRIDNNAEGATGGAASNIIGGSAAGAGNVISGNAGSGIELSGMGTEDNRIQGNFIGTNAAGDGAIQNDKWGVILSFDADNNYVGTDGDGTNDDAEGNLISGNNFDGVTILAADGNVVAGNFIGTDVSGMNPLGNQGGVWITGNSDGNYVGTNGDGISDQYERNIISGNDGWGLNFTGNATTTIVAGNYIGVDITGSGPLGNGSHGVRMNGSLGGNVIGGVAADRWNTIAFNGGDGVAILDGTGNMIRVNSIYENAGLGIDLGGDGPTINDPDDLDSGPNALQNFPELTAATVTPTDITIDGTLNSTPNTNFLIDFYYNLSPDGEGEYYIGSTGVLTDAITGDASFSANFATSVPAGARITATATSVDGPTPMSTSEFSAELLANGLPVANDDADTIDEDNSSAIDVLANDTDAEMPLTLSVLAVDTTGTLGIVTNNTTDVTYDPNAQFEYLAVGETATDTFSYTVKDGDGATDTATVTITITGTNDGPNAVDDAGAGFGTNEDVSFTTGNVLANDTDPDQDGSAPDDVLSVLSADGLSAAGATVTNLGNGTFTYDAGTIWNSLAAGETATDTFSYTVTDSNGGSDTATVTITITGTNDGPTAVDDSGAGFGTNEDSSFTTGNVLANDTDPDQDGSAPDDVLSVLSADGLSAAGATVTNLGNGTFTYDAGTIWNSLAAGETATDTFSYTMTDSNGGSDTATVTITITGTNDGPTAVDDSGAGFGTNEDVSFTTGNVLTNDTDPDQDGGAPDDVLSVLSADAISAAGATITNLGNGTFNYDTGSIFNSLAVGETATDTFSYTVTDSNGGSDTATVTITITGTNDGPTAVDDSGAGFGTNEDVSFTTGNVLANDTDPDQDGGAPDDVLSVLSADAISAAGATITNLGNGTFTYDAGTIWNSLAAGETATDTFSYTMTDSNGGSDTATVTITITGTNDGPTAVDDSGAGFGTNEDVSFTTGNVLANDTDPDQDGSAPDDVLSVLSADGTSAAGATITDLGNGMFTYDAGTIWNSLAAGETATDAFSYTVTDSNGGSDAATVTITITGTNDGPTAVDDSGAGFGTNEDVSFTTANVLANDTDPDQDGSAPDDVLSVLSADGTSAAGATITDLGNGTFTYDAGTIWNSLAAGETATDTFSYTVTDSNGGSDTATVTITITGTNDGPTAADDSGAGFATDEDTSFTTANVLANDTDPDQDSSAPDDVLSVLSADATSAGGATITNNVDGTFDYDAGTIWNSLATGETATDTFNYTVTDSNGGSDTAAVTITINGTNDGPTAVLDSGAGFATDEDTSFTTANVLANDTDPDQDGSVPDDVLSVLSADGTSAAGATITNNGDGTFDYDAGTLWNSLAAGETATDTFNYTVTDSNGGSDTATVTITISGTNDGPTAVLDSGAGFATDEDTSFTTANVLANDTDPDQDGSVPDDVLSVLSADGTSAAGATITNNGDGTFDYDAGTLWNSLAAGETATDTFNYTVTDSNGGSDTATVTITISGTNDGPTAVLDSGAGFATDEDTSFTTANVLANDTDPDQDGSVPDDVLSVLSADGTSAAGATITNNGDGTFDYDAGTLWNSLAAGETATDTFNYTVTDSNGGSDTATVTITISGTNDGPTANNDSGALFGTLEDTPFTTGNVLANDTDPDATDSLAVIGIDTSGTIGAVSDNGDGTFDYTPTFGFFGTDTFKYTVSDGKGGTDTATVTISVGSVNDVPTANDDSGSAFTTDEDSSFVTGDVLVNDTDLDTGDILSVKSIDTTLTLGIVINNSDGTFAYNPNGQFESLAVGETATDTFVYTVQDIAGDTDTATVTITINGRNDGPTAADDAGVGFDTDEDSSFTTSNVLPNDTDPDTNDTLTVVAIDTSSTLGNVTDNGDGTFDYDPNGQFESLAVGETATDTFVYTLSDGNGGTDTAVVKITIDGVNDGPTANDDAGIPFETDEDSSFTTPNVLPNDTDPDSSDTLSVSGLDTSGTLGSVIDNGDGTFDYDPAAAFESLAVGETATDTFVYTVSDGNGGTDTATVTIKVHGRNDGPTANNDSGPALATNEDTAFTTGNVLSNDVDPDSSDTLSVLSLDTSGTLGTVTDNVDGTFTYDPSGQFENLAVGESASDTFSYRVSDGNGGTDTATVTIVINGENDNPTANDDSGPAFSTLENTPFTTGNVLTNDTDPDSSDTLSVISLDTTGTVGSVTDNGDGTFDYTPVASFNGIDSFKYTVSDGNGGSDTATVTISVAPVNDPPMASDDNGAGFTTDEDSSLLTGNVLGNDTDIDTGDVLSVQSIDTTATMGTVTNNGDGTFSYDPNGQFESLAVGETATDTFVYTLQDLAGATDTATVTITINGVNDDPTGFNDAYGTSESSVVNIPASSVVTNDTDPDASDTVTVQSVDSSSTTGLVAISTSGVITYDPNGQFEWLAAGETATTSFTYTLTDGNGGTDTATVVITIDGQNDQPAANNDSGSVNEDGVLNVATSAGLLVNDTDPDSSDSLVVVSAPTTSTLGAAVTVNLDGSYSYDPTASTTLQQLAVGESAVDTITYRISDGNGGSDSATVTITVNGVNDGPIAKDDAFATDEDSVLNISAPGVLNNDTDTDTSDSLSVALASTTSSLGATVVVMADGSLSYDPASSSTLQALSPSSSLVDTFAYTVSDGKGGTDTATVSVTVSGWNDAPQANNETYIVMNDAVLDVPAKGVLANDTDIEGDPLTASVVDDVDHGTLVFNGNGSFTYTPNAAFTGTDTFTYVVNDGTTPGTAALVTINVDPGLAPPPTTTPDPIDTTDDGSTDPPPSADPPPTVEPPPEPVSDPAEPPKTTSGGGARDSDFAIPDEIEFTEFPENDELPLIGSFQTSIGTPLDGGERSFIETVNLLRSGMESTALVSLDALEFVYESSALWQALDSLEDELIAKADVQSLFVGTATGVTTSLTVGYVLWALRGSYLIASLLSSMPAWSMVDPLHVLDFFDDTKRDEDDESLESMLDKKKSTDQSHEHLDKATN